MIISKIKENQSKQEEQVVIVDNINEILDEEGSPVRRAPHSALDRRVTTVEEQ